MGSGAGRRGLLEFRRLKRPANCQSSCFLELEKSPQSLLATLPEMVRCLFCIQPISARGQRVTVVEARDRCGGRNYPLPDQAWMPQEGEVKPCSP
jgi:hypothetical protein